MRLGVNTWKFSTLKPKRFPSNPNDISETLHYHTAGYSWNGRGTFGMGECLPHNEDYF